MPEELTEKEPTNRKSVKNYALKVFKESSLSAVSSIAATGSTPRKIFRASVFLIFTAGFLYQCIKFIAHVLTFPTVVTVEIRKPDTYITPAYTFCNYNKIKRSKFCAKYPEYCIFSSEEYSNKHPKIFKENQTEVVKEENYGTYFSLSIDEILELSHDLKDLLVRSYRLSETPEGPFIRYRKRDGLHEVAPCYSYQGRVDSNLEPHVGYGKHYMQKAPDLTFTFDPREDELFSPDAEAGILFSIHSQFDAANPFINGIFLKPGFHYTVTITMHEEKLLESPYQTDCMNYTENWLKNNKKGPRSQKMCQELCGISALQKHMNCTLTWFNYPSKLRICDKDEFYQKLVGYKDELKKFRIRFEECLSTCKDECLKLKYEYQIREEKAEKLFYKLSENASLFKESRLIDVYISIDDSEIRSFEYKPQYQEVEAFSYIGGFIGIWLGVSLVEVADFFESTFRIARYFFTKKTNCSRNQNSA